MKGVGDDGEVADASCGWRRSAKLYNFWETKQRNTLKNKS